MSKDNELRLAQLIQTFGPGALVDLPDKSVLIKGLGSWNTGNGPNRMRQIKEARLVNYLTRLLKSGQDGTNWLAEDITLELYEPPLKDNAQSSANRNKVPAVVFPRWLVVTNLEQVTTQGQEPVAQKLEQFRSNTKRKRKKSETETPIRWLAACRNGHLQDIDWRWFVHQGKTACQQQLSLLDDGPGNDPQFITAQCACGARRPLSELYIKNSPLGPCRGLRPWVDGAAQQTCGEALQALTRGAINNYYTQMLRLIALPTEGSALEASLQEFLSRFDNVTNIDEVELPITHGDGTVKNALGNNQYTAEQLWAALQRVRQRNSAGQSDTVKNPKIEEYELFASGKSVIGSDALNSRLYGRTLKGSEWRGTHQGWPFTDVISSVVVLDRMCEVSALYGFTRIEPARSPFDDNLEDIVLKVSGQPLADQITWLPAMEQFGEGIFLKLDADLVRRGALAATETLQKLQDRYQEWYNRDSANRVEFPGVEYVVIHSLSHLLIEEIALEAGYPSTSLHERIYAIRSGQQAKVNQLGILIYTAGGGSQGTLGGLTEQVRALPRLLKQGLERLRICSNDPICSTPAARQAGNEDLINGAACHGCLFTAETTCERKNMLLDRTSLQALFATRTE